MVILMFRRSKKNKYPRVPLVTIKIPLVHRKKDVKPFFFQIGCKLYIGYFFPLHKEKLGKVGPIFWQSISVLAILSQRIVFIVLLNW